MVQRSNIGLAQYSIFYWSAVEVLNVGKFERNFRTCLFHIFGGSDLPFLGIGMFVLKRSLF